ncbi:MAG: YfeC-like transcriptional regulator [Planctomycetota bacterium]
MSRRMAEVYRCASLGELSGQLQRAPLPVRRRAVVAAEALHDELDEAKGYPYDFVSYRLSGYRRDGEDDAELLIGDAVRHDLRVMLDRLTHGLGLELGDWPGTVRGPDLADRLGVTPQTVNRWRRDGLRWRWVSGPEGGRRRVAFTPEAVRDFERRYGERVQAAARHTPLSATEREAVIRRAHRLRERAGVGLNAAAVHLAKRMERPTQTIRSFLLKHDASAGHAGLFTDRPKTLTDRDRRLVARALRMGVPIDRLTAKYGRKATGLRRMARAWEMRCLLPERPVCVRSGLFDREDAVAVLLRPPKAEDVEAAEPGQGGAQGLALEELPSEVRRWFGHPELKDRSVRSYVVRYHFALHRLGELYDAVDFHYPKVGQLEEARRLTDFAGAMWRPAVLSLLNEVWSLVRRDAGAQRNVRSGKGHWAWPGLLLGAETLAGCVLEYDATGPQRLRTIVRNRLLRALVSSERDGEVPERPGVMFRDRLRLGRQRG